MGKKHKTERDRSRSPTRQKKKHREEQDLSPPSRHHKSSHTNGDHSRHKKHKRRSRSHSEDEYSDGRHQQQSHRSPPPSPPQQQHRRRQSASPSPETRRPPPSSLSPEAPPSRGRGGGGGGRNQSDDVASGGRPDNHRRDENWRGKRDKGGERGGRDGGGGGGERGAGKKDGAADAAAAAAVEKEKANLGLSGKLAEDTNTFRGVVIKYNEPPEARKPKIKWRLYQFKGTEELPTLFVHRQSAYLIGRDRLIADIPVDHPSCSKQHAVLQYRLSEYTRDDGSRGKRVLPYIIDLGATNKTYLNNKPIEAQRYHELREKDVLKFGYSSREYVLLNDKSADSDDDEGAPE